MSSQACILASRANGKRSRGPITKEGKAISSRNAEKHGLLSDILIAGENVDRFEALFPRLIAEHLPATESEFDMVENMAVNRWRQMRVWGIEAECLTSEIHRQVALAPELAAAKPSARAAAGFRSLADNSMALQLASRYETRFERQYLRSLEFLRAREQARSDTSEI
ncbi:MAG: hypothetical protein M3N54_11795 [Acidobacteriota bacterium]|nr:hypothetical protein [Acidobacteriota bacterium]